MTGTVLVVLLVIAAGCGGPDPDRFTTIERLRFDPAVAPVALAVTSDGGILVGERLTGAVRVIDADGRLRDAPLVRVEVATGGQRGLLGLAVLGPRIFAAWTRPGDRRLVVGEVAPETRAVWEGPISSRLATGGHLEVSADGDLLIGVGDLQRPELVDDPTTPNGKILRVDPNGRPDQVPAVVGAGWNNPFAFTVTDRGEIWVADNSPGRRPERLGQAGAAARATDLPGRRAPAALVEIDPGRLGLCGFLDGRLVEVDITAVPPRPGEVLVADGCRTGAVRLGEDRLVLTDGERVTMVRRRP